MSTGDVNNSFIVGISNKGFRKFSEKCSENACDNMRIFFECEIHFVTTIISTLPSFNQCDVA
jgi:hypothetical protein